jgi:putative ubiquitin-RnfH superfamily antitoxin RatB of RatAB toxin-antitoxin module
MTPNSISVVFFHSPQARKVLEIPCIFPEGITVAQAWSHLIAHQIPALQSPIPLPLEPLIWGVWGRQVHSEHVLKEGDRLELYRPLQVDPKVARRQRFKKQGAKRTGLFAKRRPGSAAGY